MAATVVQPGLRVVHPHLTVARGVQHAQIGQDDEVYRLARAVLERDLLEARVGRGSATWATDGVTDNPPSATTRQAGMIEMAAFRMVTSSYIGWPEDLQGLPWEWT